MSHLVLEHLSKRYGEHFAVDDISLAVEQGEFVSLLGPSGCGKTTTLQMIAGFVEPTAGAIRMGGRDLLAVPAAKRGLGIVFQNYALFPHLSVVDNVAFGLEMRQVAKDERDRRVGETLALVGLAGLADRYPAQLSGGQQQRVALARALVIRPELLLLDEPLSNLDAKLREEMQVELLRIQRAIGITTVMVTHDQAEALALSDRVVVMNAGRIEQQGIPHEAYENPATGFVCDSSGKSNRFSRGPDRWRRRALGPLTLPVSVRWPRSSPPAPRADGASREDRLRPARSRRAGEGGEPRVPGQSLAVSFETPLGDVVVIRQNDGALQPAAGERVGTWSGGPTTFASCPTRSRARHEPFACHPREAAAIQCAVP